MVQILVNDIIPIIVIMALGYVCGKLSYFDDDQRQGLNKVVLNIALPAALFISIVKATREELAQDTTLTILGFVGIIVMFMMARFKCPNMIDLTPYHSRQSQTGGNDVRYQLITTQEYALFSRKQFSFL